jgi:hypothetical protein
MLDRMDGHDPGLVVLERARRWHRDRALDYEHSGQPVAAVYHRRVVEQLERQIAELEQQG